MRRRRRLDPASLARVRARGGIRVPVGLLPLLCAAAFVAGCGGGGGSRSATQDVGVKPGRVCNAALLRRRLAAHPPRIGYLLRNTDVDNFTGRTPIECNTRQFVYWGAPPAVPGGDQ